MMKFVAKSQGQRFLLVTVTLVLFGTLLVQSFIAASVKAHISDYYVRKIPFDSWPGGQNPPLRTPMVSKNNAIYGLSTNNSVIKYENGISEIISGGGLGTSIDVAEDGTVYITDPTNHVVRARHPNGAYTTVAGNGLISNDRSDAADATQTAFNWPTYVKIGPDGLLYIMDEGVVRRVEADGSSTHIVGKFGATAQSDPYIDGAIATDNYFPTTTSVATSINNDVHKMAFDSAGRLYITVQTSIYLLETDGTIHKIYSSPGNIYNYTPEDTPLGEKTIVTPRGELAGFDIASDDSLWLSFSNPEALYDAYGNFKYTASAIVKIKDGIVHTVVGGGNQIIGDETPGYGHELVLGAVWGLALNENGNVYFGNSNRIFNPFSNETGDYLAAVSTNTDTTPPEITPVLSGQQNEYGWHSTPVNLHWDIRDNESALVSTTGCDNTTLGGDFEYQIVCYAESNGGLSSNSVQIKIDQTSPTIDDVIITHEPIISSTGSDIRIIAQDTNSGIRKVEFYTGENDPGYGQAIPLEISGYSENGGAIFILPFGEGLTPGEYYLTVRTQDYAGNWSSNKQLLLEVIDQMAPQTLTLVPSADSYIRSGNSNRNHGSDITMNIQSSGSNRALVQFDQTVINNTIGGGNILSAELQLNITENGNNWGSSGRTVDVHRILSSWTEGNGTDFDRGTGSGVTWDCAVDVLIQNQTKDCSGITEWEMGQPSNPSIHPWLSNPTSTRIIINGQYGILGFDVTEDVRAFKDGSADNFGWLIKKTIESQNGRAGFSTRESTYKPQLIIVYQP